MPSTIYTPEIASAYGALDSDAAADGSAATAHLLRAAARSMHRLLAKPEPVLAALYDTRVPDSEGRAMSGPALPWWTVVETYPINAMRGRTSIDVRITLRVPVGTDLRLQVCTRAQVFLLNPPVGAYKTATATGAWETVEWDGLPIDSSGVDEVTVYVAASAGSTLGATATYGNPNTGTVQSATGFSMQTTAATTWVTTSGNTWAMRHLLVFLSGAVILTTPRLITAVFGTNPGQLLFEPALTAGEAAQVAGSTYEIRTLPLWRLAAVTAWTSQRATL